MAKLRQVSQLPVAVPELPEVETLRRNLEPTLVGRRFSDVLVTLPKLFLPEAGLSLTDLKGRRVERLRRRAKFLLIELSGGLTLVFHFRMSGQLVQRTSEGGNIAAGGHPVPNFEAPLPHKATHAQFTLDDGSILYLTDIRQFGRVWLLPSAAVGPFLDRAGLGPEPLDDEFTEADFQRRLFRRPRATLKPLLLDQSFIGGVGNIYADEIAFEARLNPLTPVGSLSPRKLKELYHAIRLVLDHAVTHGVAEILNGRASPDHDFPRVHGREGQRCPRCGTPVLKTRVAGRGTYHCPRCQRLAPLSASRPSRIGAKGAVVSRKRARAT